ncbi:peptidoglycan-binding LysM domain-containing protein [Wolffia australiana]
MQVDESSRKGIFPLLLPKDLFTDELSSSLSSSSCSPERSTAQLSYIEHQVSKLDTVAGVAIKYGVEVVDIKRANSLVTDLQMFGLKTLKIPRPGRHPPSPITSNGLSGKGEQELDWKPQGEFLKSCRSLPENGSQRKISRAMSSLLGYYGLSTPDDNSKDEGTEMAIYLSQSLDKSFEDSQNKSVNLVSNSPKENGQRTMSTSPTIHNKTERSTGKKPVRRRQKVDDDVDIERSFEQVPKYGSRLEFESLMTNGVIKSTNASNLLDADRSPSSWSTSKRSTKSDSPSKPFFDGLPKPITFRKNKAAID